MSRSRIYAITDIGSNTVKCDIFKVSAGNGTQLKIESLDFLSEKLGLIARVENDRLPASAIDLLCDTVLKYQKRAAELNADVFTSFGTAVMRRIGNFGEVERAVHERNDVQIELISGEDEARLSFIGARTSDPAIKRGIMVDMGGASTELIDFTNNSINKIHSFPFGCLYLYKNFVSDRFPAADEAEAIARFVTHGLSEHKFNAEGGNLVLIGGTGKAIRKLLSHLGYTSYSNPTLLLSELAYKFSNPSEDDIRLLEELIPARVETVIPGLLAYIAIAKHTGAKDFTVSDGGIREGYLQTLITKDGFSK